MHLKYLLIVPAAAATFALVGMSPASAGEVTGTGDLTPGGDNASSICVFSGLADGGEGEPAGPGNVQNWGHAKSLYGDTPAERKASGFQPGDSCNGHSGFLSGGGGEE